MGKEGIKSPAKIPEFPVIMTKGINLFLWNLK